MPSGGEVEHANPATEASSEACETCMESPNSRPSPNCSICCCYSILEARFRYTNIDPGGEFYPGRRSESLHHFLWELKNLLRRGSRVPVWCHSRLDYVRMTFSVTRADQRVPARRMSKSIDFGKQPKQYMWSVIDV